MGYSICWEFKRYHSLKDLKKYNKIWNDTYNKEILKIKAKGLNINHYEWVGDKPMSNNDFEFMKTARIPYDYAVKKALIAVQIASKDGWNITCDDGFQYTSKGLIFDGKGYIDEYKPIKKYNLTLFQLPIKYKSKGQGMLTNGEYDWNENKKPKILK